MRESGLHQVAVSYTDLGATITGPQANLDLGIHLFVEWRSDAVPIDTSTRLQQTEEATDAGVHADTGS